MAQLLLRQLSPAELDLKSNTEVSSWKLES